MYSSSENAIDICSHSDRYKECEMAVQDTIDTPKLSLSLHESVGPMGADRNVGGYSLEQRKTQDVFSI